MREELDQLFEMISSVLPDPTVWKFPLEATSPNSAVVWLKENEQKFLPIEHALLPSSVEKFSLVNINNKEDDSLCVDLKPTGSTVTPTAVPDVIPKKLSCSFAREPVLHREYQLRGRKKSKDIKKCHNCQCTSTTMWRKSPLGDICNSCRLYANFHNGKMRPKEFWNKAIMRRNRQ